jgi:hypothetical protein
VFEGILHKKDGTGHLPGQFIVAATEQNMFQVSFLMGKHDELCYIYGKIINKCLAIRDFIFTPRLSSLRYIIIRKSQPFQSWFLPGIFISFTLHPGDIFFP